MPACSLVNLVCPFRLQSQNKCRDPLKRIPGSHAIMSAFCKLTDVSPDRAGSVTLQGRGKENGLLAATLGDCVGQRDVQ